MPEIVVISGKGGTGKTSLTAAFAHLAKNKVICDLDVDAPDLHLLLKPEIETRQEFYSGHEARVISEKCQGCGRCAELCRFGAIALNGQMATVDSLKCEGCKVCFNFCPAEAITFSEKHCGQWYTSQTRFGPFVHAQLFPGEENSGKLVSLLKQKARELAETRGLDLILADGAPGIGCPVISSLSGADLAVAVTEPTPSGRHDLERVIDLCAHFGVPAGVIVNKYDLNLDQTRRIEEFCSKRGLELLARLPHDLTVTEAMVKGQAITEFEASRLADLVSQAWQKTLRLVGLKQAA